MFYLSRDLGKENTTDVYTMISKLNRDKNDIRCPYNSADSVYNNKTDVQKPAVSRRRQRKTTLRTKNRSRAYLKGNIPSVDKIPHKTLNDCVINLSSKVNVLSSHQLLLFYLGKSFAPTPPRPDYSSLKQALIEFAYSLRWRWFFHKSPSSKKLDPQIEEMERQLIPRSSPKHIASSNNHV